MVRGRFQDGVRSLPFAVIEAATSAGRRSTLADGTGRYHLTDLPPGELLLRATATGHASVQVRVNVPRGGTVALDLELTAEPLRLDGVSVSADSARLGAADRTLDPVGGIPDPRFEVTMLEISPSIGEAGMIDAVQALPGNDPSDPSDVLFMRGSTTELKLVLLDGVPVFTPFHVAGLMRSFEPAVLGSADLHVGGAPARYDGGLTHILDLRTRAARRDGFRASGAVDLLSASLAAETPLGSKAGVIASARSLHDLGEGPLGGERPYGYRDLLASVEVDPAEGHRLRATGFWNEESIRLDFPTGDSDAAWSNHAGAVTYATSLGAARLSLTGGGSRYQATLPLQPTARPGEPKPSAVLASATSDRARVVGEVAWGESEPVRVGASYEDQRALFGARSMDDGTRSATSGSSRAVGAFVDATRILSPGVTLRAGLRGDLFAGDALRLAPRAAIFWAFSPDALLSVAAGRYHQAGRTPDPQVEGTLSALANDAVRSGELLPVATADHVVVSLGQRLGTATSLGMDGYWKRFSGLRGDPETSILNSGVDLRLLSANDRGSFWVGYGLSWFWSELDLSGRGTDFAGRHMLSAGLSGDLAGPFRGEARIAYGAGLPSTSISFGSADAPLQAGGPVKESVTGSAAGGTSPLDESFLRLDLELHAVFEPEWGGHRWRVRPYLRLLNALDRRDALFYTYQPWRSDEVTPLAERPILPVLGVAFTF